MYLATLNPAMFKVNVKYNKTFSAMLKNAAHISIYRLWLQLTFRLLQYKEVENYIFQLTLDFFQN